MTIPDSRRRAGLYPLEYGWLFLPLLFAFLAFPLARIALAGLCFVWVAALLFQRARGCGYIRAWLMTALMMVLWVGVCALLTRLADGLFQWAGETLSGEGRMVTVVLTGSFAVYGVAASVAARLLRIATWPDAAVLFAGVMAIAAGAVMNGILGTSWLFPAGVLAASGVVFVYLYRNRRAIILKNTVVE